MSNIRNCPFCDREIVYAKKDNYLRALSRNSPCRDCYDKRRLDVGTTTKLIDMAGQIINGNLFLELCSHRSKHNQLLWLTECVNCKIRKNKLANQVKRTGGCRNCYGMSKGEGGLTRLFNIYNRQATDAGKTFALSFEEFKKITSDICHYCGVKPAQLIKSTDKGGSDWSAYYYNGIDRKDNAVGYLLNNCVPCCWTCNRAKRDRSYDEFVSWLGRIAEFKTTTSVKVYVLCGMIASGKSTYCRNAAKAGQLIVNDDSIVNMLHGDDYTLYDKGLKLIYKSMENQVISSALLMKKSIVVDRGLNISVEGRRRLLAIAKSFDVKCEAIVFPKAAPEEHARRRFESSARGHNYDYWLGVALFHDKRYVEPSEAEGFDAVHYITYDEVLAGKVL